MTTTFVDMTGATLKFAATEAALAAATQDPSCQIISVRLATVINRVTAPAVICDGVPIERLGPSSSTLEIEAYADWTDPDGYCVYATTNDGTEVWFELTIPGAGSQTGQVGISKPDFGGSAGEPLQFTQSLPTRDVVYTPPPAAP